MKRGKLSWVLVAELVGCSLGYGGRVLVYLA